MKTIILKKSLTNERENGFNDWIDRELICHSTARKQIADSDLDALLELRDLMKNHQSCDPAFVIREFFRLRRRLEVNFYLLCYRLRNWVSVYYELEVSDPLERVEPETVPLDLTSSDFAGLLKRVKRDFFEDAAVVIPPGDIRIRVIEK